MKLFMWTFLGIIAFVLSAPINQVTYRLIGAGKTCSRKTAYTIKPGKCDGWPRTSLEDCMKKCTANELPPGCNGEPNQSNCKYVVWDDNKDWLPGWCQLASDTCHIIGAKKGAQLYEKQPGNKGAQLHGRKLRGKQQGDTCRDDYSICIHWKRYCDNTLLHLKCKKTCDLCPVNDEASRDDPKLAENEGPSDMANSEPTESESNNDNENDADDYAGDVTEPANNAESTEVASEPRDVESTEDNIIEFRNAFVDSSAVIYPEASKDVETPLKDTAVYCNGC